MRRLVWAFAGRTYHIVEILMSRLKFLSCYDATLWSVTRKGLLWVVVYAGAGWSEPLLVAHTTLLEISCRGSNFYPVMMPPYGHPHGFVVSSCLCRTLESIQIMLVISWDCNVKNQPFSLDMTEQEFGWKHFIIVLPRAIL